MLTYRTMQSPLGSLVLSSDGTAVTSVRTGKNMEQEGISPLLEQCERELQEYFAGRRTSFTVPIKEEGTVFQKSVWLAMRSVPFGQTVSYGEIAKRVRSPRAVRAVGGACGKNPLLILNPCHRVLRSDGQLGGFSGGLNQKRILLGLEQHRTQPL